MVLRDTISSRATSGPFNSVPSSRSTSSSRSLNGSIRGWTDAARAARKAGGRYDLSSLFGFSCFSASNTPSSRLRRGCRGDGGRGCLVPSPTGTQKQRANKQQRCQKSPSGPLRPCDSPPRSIWQCRRASISIILWATQVSSTTDPTHAHVLPLRCAFGPVVC
jgi:hypothetical protein